MIGGRAAAPLACVLATLAASGTAWAQGGNPLYQPDVQPPKKEDLSGFVKRVPGGASLPEFSGAQLAQGFFVAPRERPGRRRTRRGARERPAPAVIEAPPLTPAATPGTAASGRAVATASLAPSIGWLPGAAAVLALGAGVALLTRTRA